jgi:hypothetical protein
MKSPLTILGIATAAYTIGGAGCFQLLPPPPPSSSSSALSSTAALRTIQNHDCSDAVIDDTSSPSSTTILSDESPQSLGPKRTFLGMRRESGVMRRMMQEQQPSQVSLAQKYSSNSSRGVGLSTTTAASSTTTALSSSATALMPDGGLSPCVIKVLGVGGGGSNAVRVCFTTTYCVSRLYCFYFVLPILNTFVPNFLFHLFFVFLFFRSYITYSIKQSCPPPSPITSTHYYRWIACSTLA